MVHGYDPMSGIKRMFPVVCLIAGLMLPENRAEALTSGIYLTNYVKGMFSLASGATIAETIPGRSKINIPNSASAWVLVTDEPQLCFAITKVAMNKIPSWVLMPQASPGQRLCFTVSFSNCGTQTVQSLVIRDRTPSNVSMEASWDPKYWYDIPPAEQKPITINWFMPGSSVPELGYIGGQVGPIDIEFTFYDVRIGVSGYINYCVTVL